jgi:hypothetical protein
MRTFKLVLGLDFKVVVPDQFIKLWRGQAQDPAACTKFLQDAQAKHPEDDEQFILHVLKHGVRRHARQGLVDLFAASGLGCTLSPATVQENLTLRALPALLHGTTTGRTSSCTPNTSEVARTNDALMRRKVEALLNELEINAGAVPATLSFMGEELREMLHADA